VTPHQAIVLAGWRRLEAAALAAGNRELAEQARYFAELLENPPERAPVENADGSPRS
jgi:hypothetical protein